MSPRFTRLPTIFFKAVASTNSSIKLGRIFGIPIRLHFTWFIIFILVTLSLSLYEFPSAYPLWERRLYWIMGIITGLLFFACLLAHELSHSLVSKANGVPVRSITLFVFGGVAQISREAATPTGELKMAVAGPASSVAISGIFFVIWLFTRAVSEPVSALGFWLGRINLALAVFNLIPGFPLDGGRVLRSVLWQTTNNFRKATRVATVIGQGVGYFFIVGGIVLVFHRNLVGIWTALIGWFLENAASASYRQAVLREALATIRASEIMSTDCVPVPINLTISRLAQDYIFPSGRRCFMVTDDGYLRGIITLKDIKAVPQDQWPRVTVERAITPLGKMRIAHPDDNVAGVMDVMNEADISQIPVVLDNRVVGVIGTDTLVRFIRTRPELRS